MSTAPTDPLTVPWHAIVNDLVGGWDVATVDKPCSEHDHAAGEISVGCFLTEAVARHVAEAHNERAVLRGILRKLKDAHVVEVTGLSAYDGSDGYRETAITAGEAALFDAITTEAPTDGR